MKGIVLAAGQGKRLRPLTDNVAKEMIVFWGKPLLEFIIERLVEAGVKDLVIVISPEKKEQVLRYFGRGKRIGVRLQYAVQDQPRGPAHALLQAKPYIDTKHFLVQYGDSFADTNIPAHLLERLSEEASVDGLLAVRKVDDPSRYGIAKFRGDEVIEVQEKPDPTEAASTMAVMGTYILRTKTFFDSIHEITFGPGKEVFPPEYALRNGARMKSWVFEGSRVDVGTPKDLFEASRLLQKVNKGKAAFEIRSIIFDGDNTLYDTKSIARDCDLAAMTVLSEHCGKNPEDLYNQWTEIVQEVKTSSNPKLRHRRNSYTLLAMKFNVRCSEEMYSAFLANLERMIRPFPASKKLLGQLEDKKLKLLLVTEDSADATVKKLHAVGLWNYFISVLTSDETRVTKPSEKYYSLAQRLLGTHSSQILVVGDDFERDLVIAKLMGMHVLLVTEPNNDLLKVLAIC